jgi:Family of unknown function (DUF6491)
MTKSAMLLGTVALFALATPALADPASDTAPRPRCFLSNQFENWKSPDPKTIYIRVNMHQYYRLDLANECHALSSPGAFLVTKIHGSSSICTALDWDLHVSRTWDIAPEACIVKKMTELTPEEVAAIPPKFKP